MDEFREMAGKNACMTMGCSDFDGDSHTRKADWFGMTALFDAQSFLHKFQFVCVFIKADSLYSNLSVYLRKIACINYIVISH